MPLFLSVDRQSARTVGIAKPRLDLYEMQNALFFSDNMDLTPSTGKVPR